MKTQKRIQISDTVVLRMVKNELDEFEVRVARNGEARTAETYFTDDKEDALATMTLLAERMKQHDAGAWSARCDCRNGHPSNSGRCNVREAADPTTVGDGPVFCSSCREHCGRAS